MAIDLKKLVRDVTDTDKILTPRLTEYLIQHGDDEYPDWVVEIIADLLRTKPRDRSGSFASSSAGACWRRQELGFLGMPQVGAIDPQLQNLFNDGKWRHLRWQAMLLSAGLLTHAEFALHWQRKRSRGTMDGIGVVPDDHPKNHWRGKEFGFELKGITPYKFQGVKNIGPETAHLDQTHRYFLSSGMELFIIIYENKATQEWCEWVIEADPVRLDDQRNELDQLNWAIENKTLHAQLPMCAMRKGPEWTDCPFAGQGGVCESAGMWPRLPAKSGMARSAPSSSGRVFRRSQT